jgi:hypothetical protein
VKDVFLYTLVGFRGRARGEGSLCSRRDSVQL